MTSLIRLDKLSLMAGAVENAASCKAGICCAVEMITIHQPDQKAPVIAPSICAEIYGRTDDQASFPATAMAIVTAGFRCAPLYGFAITIPI